MFRQPPGVEPGLRPSAALTLTTVSLSTGPMIASWPTTCLGYRLPVWVGVAPRKGRFTNYKNHIGT